MDIHFATNIFQQKQSTLIFIIKTGKNLFRLFSPTQMVEHTLNVLDRHLLLLLMLLLDQTNNVWPLYVD